MEALSFSQLQVPGIGVEVGLEVGNGHTVGVNVVDAESSTHVNVLNVYVVALQLVLYFVNSVAQCHKVAHVKYLRAYVKVKPDKAHMLHLRGFLNGRFHVVHVYAELVFC